MNSVLKEKTFTEEVEDFKTKEKIAEDAKKRLSEFGK